MTGSQQAQRHRDGTPADTAHRSVGDSVKSTLAGSGSGSARSRPSVEASSSRSTDPEGSRHVCSLSPRTRPKRFKKVQGKTRRSRSHHAPRRGNGKTLPDAELARSRGTASPHPAAESDHTQDTDSSSSVSESECPQNLFLPFDSPSRPSLSPVRRKERRHRMVVKDTIAPSVSRTPRTAVVPAKKKVRPVDGHASASLGEESNSNSNSHKISADAPLSAPAAVKKRVRSHSVRAGRSTDRQIKLDDIAGAPLTSSPSKTGRKRHSSNHEISASSSPSSSAARPRRSSMAHGAAREPTKRNGRKIAVDEMPSSEGASASLPLAPSSSASKHRSSSKSRRRRTDDSDREHRRSKSRSKARSKSKSRRATRDNNGDSDKSRRSKASAVSSSNRTRSPSRKKRNETCETATKTETVLEKSSKNLAKPSSSTSAAAAAAAAATVTPNDETDKDMSAGTEATSNTAFTAASDTTGAPVSAPSAANNTQSMRASSRHAPVKPQRQKSVEEKTFVMDMPSVGITASPTTVTSMASTATAGSSSQQESDLVRSLQSQLSDAHHRIRELNDEHRHSKSEADRIRADLIHLKMEHQKSKTERRELALELEQLESALKEKDRKIQVLEKAVESQLDQVDELTRELERSNEDVADLEDQIMRLEMTIEEQPGESQRQMADERQRRLDKRATQLQEREEAMAQKEQKMADTIERQQQEIAELKRQLAGRSDESEHRSEMARKDETIAFLKMELGQLKKSAGGHMEEDDATKALIQVVNSKYDGERRRNRMLEDEIEHWKSVNCELENDLAMCKSDVAEWKYKYECATSDSASVQRLAVDDSEVSQRSGIGSIWNRLVTPGAMERRKVNADMPPGLLLQSMD